MIEFRGVSKRFDDGTEAVHVLDLVASEGQITVLVGPSGCGKTTSLRMVNRMVEPSSGTVLFGGRNVRSQSRLSCAGASATSSSRPGCSRTAPS
jgi:osmoprotectant transport system ATP-binding protein